MEFYRPHITWLKDGIELNSFSEHEHVIFEFQLDYFHYLIGYSQYSRIVMYFQFFMFRFSNGKLDHTN